MSTTSRASSGLGVAFARVFGAEFDPADRRPGGGPERDEERALACRLGGRHDEGCGERGRSHPNAKLFFVAPSHPVAPSLLTGPHFPQSFCIAANLAKVILKYNAKIKTSEYCY